MGQFLTMPKLGLTMETGVLLKWRKAEGEAVRKGEVYLEIESDKANVELESDADGILLKHWAKEGAEVPCGDPLAYVGEFDEVIPAWESKRNIKQPEQAQILNSKENLIADPAVLGGHTALQPDRIFASPRARKLASENQLDLALVTNPTGPNGRIREKDVLEYLSGSTKSGVQKISIPNNKYREEKLSPVRSVIARRLTEAKSSIPHFYLEISADMTNLNALRSAYNAKNPQAKLSYNALFCKLCASALQKHPYVNASFAGDSIRLFESVPIGLAVASDKGLFVPVVKDCHAKSVLQIQSDLDRLIPCAREGRLLPADTEGAAFTITNLGMYEIEYFSAVIHPPAAAILAIPKITDTPVVHSGHIVIRPICRLGLSADHRVMDGAGAAAFFMELKRLFESPVLGLLKD